MAQPQQTQSRTLDLSPEDIEKIQRAKEKAEGKAESDVDPEWFALAEFGSYYGYEAVERALNNEIPLERFSVMLKAGRKVWHSKVVDLAEAQFIAATAAATSDPGKNFQKLAQHLIKRTEVAQ